MIKAFIFDMDGVIIDSEPLHFESDRMVMKDFGIELSDEELNRYVGVDNTQMWLELKDKYKIDVSVDDLLFRQHSNKVELLKTRELKPINGIPELISRLIDNNIAIALASSSSMKFIRFVLDKLVITNYFDVVVSGEHVERSKPEPDIFLRAAQLLNVSPGSCVVLEDSEHGVNAAKRAGMKCIGFLNPNSGSQNLFNADKVVITLEELEYMDLFNTPEKEQY